MAAGTQIRPLIEQQSALHAHITGIKLSRNRGHQNALLAGLFPADGDAVISIDADLQDDLAAIEQMLDAQFLAAWTLCMGCASDATPDTRFKRVSAEAYYRLLAGMGVEIVFNHATTACSADVPSKPSYRRRKATFSCAASSRS